MLGSVCLSVFLTEVRAFNLLNASDASPALCPHTYYYQAIDDLASQAHSMCSCCAIIIEECNTIILPMVEIQNATFE